MPAGAGPSGWRVRADGAAVPGRSGRPVPARGRSCALRPSTAARADGPPRAGVRESALRGGRPLGPRPRASSPERRSSSATGRRAAGRSGVHAPREARAVAASRISQPRCGRSGGCACPGRRSLASATRPARLGGTCAARPARSGVAPTARPARSGVRRAPPGPDPREGPASAGRSPAARCFAPKTGPCPSRPDPGGPSPDPYRSPDLGDTPRPVDDGTARPPWRAGPPAIRSGPERSLLAAAPDPPRTAPVPTPARHVRAGAVVERPSTSRPGDPAR